MSGNNESGAVALRAAPDGISASDRSLLALATLSVFERLPRKPRYRCGEVYGHGGFEQPEPSHQAPLVVLVRKRLRPDRLPNREVAHLAVQPPKHALAPATALSPSVSAIVGQSSGLSAWSG